MKPPLDLKHPPPSAGFLQSQWDCRKEIQVWIHVTPSQWKDHRIPGGAKGSIQLLNLPVYKTSIAEPRSEISQDTVPGFLMRNLRMPFQTSYCGTGSAIGCLERHPDRGGDRASGGASLTWTAFSKCKGKLPEAEHLEIYLFPIVERSGKTAQGGFLESFSIPVREHKGGNTGGGDFWKMQCFPEGDTRPWPRSVPPLDMKHASYQGGISGLI